MTDLVLNLKKEYFDQIRSGEKTEEYREFKPFWIKRLMGKKFTGIQIKLGYPKKGEKGKKLRYCWSGYNIKKVNLMGEGVKTVFAIPLIPFDVE